MRTCASTYCAYFRTNVEAAEYRGVEAQNLIYLDDPLVYNIHCFCFFSTMDNPHHCPIEFSLCYSGYLYHFGLFLYPYIEHTNIYI